MPQTSSTDKGPLLTGSDFRTICKKLNQKMIYGTPYMHTTTSFVVRRRKPLKDLMRTNFEDNMISDENNSAIKKKRNYVPATLGRTPRTELNSFLNILSHVKHCLFQRHRRHYKSNHSSFKKRKISNSKKTEKHYRNTEKRC